MVEGGVGECGRRRCWRVGECGVVEGGVRECGRRSGWRVW